MKKQPCIVTARNLEESPVKNVLVVNGISAGWLVVVVDNLVNLQGTLVVNEKTYPNRSMKYRLTDYRNADFDTYIPIVKIKLHPCVSCDISISSLEPKSWMTFHFVSWNFSLHLFCPNVCALLGSNTRIGQQLKGNWRSVTVSPLFFHHTRGTKITFRLHMKKIQLAPDTRANTSKCSRSFRQ